MKNLWILITILSFQIACSNESDSNLYAPSISGKMDETAVSEESEWNEQDKMQGGSAGEVNKPVSVERKLIKRGTVGFETSELSETIQFVTNLTKEVEGYISSENLYHYNNRKEQQMIVRMPSNRFDSFISKLGDEAGEFDNKSIDVSDVTEEYIDVESRLKTKKELELRYIEILKQSKKVSDLLEVERELSYVRSDIESMEGRLRYLSDQVSFSTLSINFYEFGDVKAIGFFSEIGKQFKNGWRSLKSFTLGLIGIWPFLILIVVIIFFIRKWLKNRRARA